MTGRPVAMRLVAEPVALGSDHARPVIVREVTLRELCEVAGIPCRVTTNRVSRILLHVGPEHYHFLDECIVGGVRDGVLGSVAALRVLEVLAYAFMDYGARESVCGRGLFVARKPAGRPALLGRRRTAAERMRAMRTRVKRTGYAPVEPKNRLVGL